MTASDPIQLAQEVFREDPVVVVGSGVSIGISAGLRGEIEDGFPSMDQLGEHLFGASAVPPERPDGLRAAWERCREVFNRSNDFEEALDAEGGGAPDLTEWAVRRISEKVAKPDRAIRRYYEGRQRSGDTRHREDFGLARLLRRLIDGVSERWPVVTVVTTNYDQMVELACDLEKIPCHTGFMGHRSRWFVDNQKEWGLRCERRAGKRARIRPLHHVRLYKPHGSLTWSVIDGEVREFLDDTDNRSPLLVSPGLAKARTVTSDPVLDRHREWTTSAIRKAKSALILGYGFNDSHLETALRKRLKRGMKALLLTRKMTRAARRLLEQSPGLVSGEEAASSNGATTWDWRTQGEPRNAEIPGNAWDLTTFVNEFL